MEDKQLDFNAPLLSVRRFSSPARVSSQAKETHKTDNAQGIKHYIPPYYISDLKSGPMRNPGEVPFMWEQIPGRRKDGQGSQDRSIERRPFVAPKLPPGRTSTVKPQSWDKEFEEKTTIRPQKDYEVVSHQNVSLMNGNVPTLKSSKVGTETKKDIDSENEDDVYADALDTLSRTESSFFNCSVSGISGLDDMNLKRSGASSTDRHTQDFMMDRFLPAAKAMASDTPQHASWRQPVPREQPIMARKVVDANRRPPVYHYRGNIPQYVEETVDDESEDEDEDYGDTGNSSTKACGLLPKFRLKNSFCLLNPVPGVKIRSRAPYPSVRTFSTHVKPAFNGSYSATDKENNWEAVYKHKLISGLQPLDAESKMTTESNQLTLWSDSQTPDGSSSRMNSVGGGISPFRSDAIQSPFQEGMGFLGIPKQIKSIETNNSTPHKDSKWGSGSLSTMVEKTLYVDSENMQTSISNFSSSDTHGMIDCREVAAILTGCRKIDDPPCAVSFPEDVNNLTISQEMEISKSKKSEVVSSTLWSSPGELNPVKLIDRTERLRKGNVHAQEVRAMMSSKVRINGNLEFAEPESLKEEDPGNSIVCSLQLPLPPPLPKSPSESWLWRTLPSISSKNASFHPRKQPLKTPSTDPKWETIVKTSHVHHGHLRFSEELKKPLPQSKT
ncbi:putative arginine N-methyltransferase [Thalictrum thalictroides]|uniref:Putative arginine N-methyltransferase n=1 Tax=Thalictrum thalictroides TaxID=46969 RepID=A0A7J6WKV9_THATH|nr:putative arginine N-methyltransferase [Thalictrum thalictroides]